MQRVFSHDPPGLAIVTSAKIHAPRGGTGGVMVGTKWVETPFTNARITTYAKPTGIRPPNLTDGVSP
jgi:hypothetical protein